MKHPIIVSSHGRTSRAVRMRRNLDYHGIARRAINEGYLTNPLVDNAIKYHTEIDISAVCFTPSSSPHEEK